MAVANKNNTLILLIITICFLLLAPYFTLFSQIFAGEDPAPVRPQFNDVRPARNSSANAPLSEKNIERSAQDEGRRKLLEIEDLLKNNRE